MNLTCISICDKISAFRPNVVVLSAGSLVEDYRLVSTIFKVKNHLRSFAQHKLCACSYRLSKGKFSNKITRRCGNTFYASGKDKARNRTNFFIGKGKYDVRSLKDNISGAVFCRNVQADRLPIRNREFTIAEGNRIWNNNTDSNFTYNIAIIDHLNNSITSLFACGKYTVNNSTHGRIVQLPCDIFRDIGRSASLVNTCRRD